MRGQKVGNGPKWRNKSVLKSLNRIYFGSLEKGGYEALLMYFQKIALHLNEQSRLRRDGERLSSSVITVDRKSVV